MPFSVTTPPATELVSTADAKTHLRLGDVASGQESYIDTLVKTARILIENEVGRAFINQTITLKIDRFPRDNKPIYLPQPPLSSVTSISYLDTDGNSQTFASSKYIVDTIMEPGRISLAYEQTWPQTRSIENAVTIVYVAGYGVATTDVPETVIHAIKLIIDDWYNNRGSESEFPKSAVALISNFTHNGDYLITHNVPL